LRRHYDRRAATLTRRARAIDATAKAFEVPHREILSKIRIPTVTRARLALYVALYDACATSSTDMAWRLKRDHSTLLWGIRRAREMAFADPDYADRVRLIQAAALGIGDMRRAA
jgi:chromosomal replication initiation ATPase DnaA